MENNKVVNNTEENVSVESVAENNAPENKKTEKEQEFKFFKCCSASLKRLAIVTFVINKNKATATDVITLIKDVQKIVFEKHGVMLETEVKIIGD